MGLWRKVVACRHCDKKSGVRKHGTGRSGLQRYYCSECQRTFQMTFSYRAYEPIIEAMVLELAKGEWSTEQIADQLNIRESTVKRYIGAINMPHPEVMS